MPGKNENRMSEKGIAKESGHPTTIHKEMKVGSSDKHGIRFGAFHDHPDKSVIRSPEKK